MASTEKKSQQCGEKNLPTGSVYKDCQRLQPVVAEQTVSSTTQFDNDIEARLIIAEFNTLREEILKRIEHGHRLASLTLLAAGALFTFSLKDMREQPLVEAYLFLLYPLFALFMAMEWSFNNMRIVQLGTYLRKYIEEKHRHTEMLGWENFLAKTNTELAERGVTGEWAAVRGTFIGTQCGAILAAWFFGIAELEFQALPNPSPIFLSFIILTLVNIFTIIHTYSLIRCSCEQPKLKE